MQLSQSTDFSAFGTVTGLDQYGNPIDITGTDTAASAPDTSAMDSAVHSAVTSSTDFLGNLNLTDLINSVATSYVTVAKAVNAGSAAPGTATHPAIGKITPLQGGGTMVVNADGSTTITDAAGTKKTIMPNGTVVSGGPSAFGSVSTSTILIGIALLGLVVKVL